MVIVSVSPFQTTLSSSSSFAVFTPKNARDFNLFYNTIIFNHIEFFIFIFVFLQPQLPLTCAIFYSPPRPPAQPPSAPPSAPPPCPLLHFLILLIHLRILDPNLTIPTTILTSTLIPFSVSTHHQPPSTFSSSSSSSFPVLFFSLPISLTSSIPSRSFSPITHRSFTNPRSLTF